ncbi:aminotransferase class IV [Aquimarina rhabdastrellae]
MVNINGNLLNASEATIALNNRGYAYGDALFETIRVNAGTILFWEEHYFRLMASMRILRMQIPMSFTPEFLQQEIQDLIAQNGFTNSAVRVKITVHRESLGLYTPENNEVGYTITVRPLDNSFYTIDDHRDNEVILYKDYYVNSGLLSTLKTNNKITNVLAGIFAKENGFQNAILLNTNKMVTETINGNLFLVKGNTIKTPPITDGCLKGVLRGQLLEVLKKLPEFTVKEETISPFELQKADELFTTNVIQGIVPITKFRKKIYANQIARRLLGTLNAKIRLS